MKTISPLKAIRLNCLSCSGDSFNEVKQCPIKDCQLYPFRFGKNPHRKPISEEERQKRSERLKHRFQAIRPR
jgi:hypothetical protein